MRLALPSIKEKAATLSATTIQSYEQALKRPAAVFGEMKLEDINFLMVKQFITDLQTTKAENGKKPLTASARKVRNAVRRLCLGSKRWGTDGTPLLRLEIRIRPQPGSVKSICRKCKAIRRLFAAMQLSA